MTTTTWVLVAIAALLIGGLAVWAATRSRRSRALRERFGPEYERELEVTGSRGQAEKELERRETRAEGLQLRPLDAAARERYARRWKDVQARFVDSPAAAAAEAEALLNEVMESRGYPVGDFEQRAADLSVHYPGMVQHYRGAHEIATRAARGQADTESLRQALVHYRALFQELLHRDAESGARPSTG
ncbi:MAG: hypothetical protein ACRELV_00890 [Longimicrobiales bacterium]